MNENCMHSSLGAFIETLPLVSTKNFLVTSRLKIK